MLTADLGVDFTHVLYECSIHTQHNNVVQHVDLFRIEKGIHLVIHTTARCASSWKSKSGLLSLRTSQNNPKNIKLQNWEKIKKWSILTFWFGDDYDLAPPPRTSGGKFLGQLAHVILGGLPVKLTWQAVTCQVIWRGAVGKGDRVAPLRMRVRRAAPGSQVLPHFEVISRPRRTASADQSRFLWSLRKETQRFSCSNLETAKSLFERDQISGSLSWKGPQKPALIRRTCPSRAAYYFKI